jgi:hypothetical protein
MVPHRAAAMRECPPFAVRRCHEGAPAIGVAARRAAFALLLVMSVAAPVAAQPAGTASPGAETSGSTQTPTFPRVKLGSWMFLSYQDGEASGAAYSRFTVKRAYLDLTAAVAPDVSARVTTDVTQDSSGDWKVRLKYAYAVLNLPQAPSVVRPYLEFGIVHTPWIEFEEKVDRYRMQDTLFLERVGIMSSADAGAMVAGVLGGEMPAEYQKGVSGAFPGRYGSFAVGIYNGGGYTASEQNTDKVLEGRLSLRPLSAIAPGLQVSYFGVRGKGNTASEPEWTANVAALTFESRILNAVGIVLSGRGNSKGDAVDAGGRALERRGWSGFLEGKLSPAWSVIGRLDDFTPDVRSARVSTRRTIAGVAYHMVAGVDVLLDRDDLAYRGTARPSDTRTQLTLQLKF